MYVTPDKYRMNEEMGEGTDEERSGKRGGEYWEGREEEDKVGEEERSIGRIGEEWKRREGGRKIRRGRGEKRRTEEEESIV